MTSLTSPLPSTTSSEIGSAFATTRLRHDSTSVGAVDETVKVKAIDQVHRTVTVTGPLGNSYPVKVDETVSAFEDLSVGASIHLRFVEAIAIQFEKA